MESYRNSAFKARVEKNLGRDATGRPGGEEGERSQKTAHSHSDKGEHCEVRSPLGLIENKIVGVPETCFIRVQEQRAVSGR